MYKLLVLVVRSQEFFVVYCIRPSETFTYDTLVLFAVSVAIWLCSCCFGIFSWGFLISLCCDGCLLSFAFLLFLSA